jgi:hypothetical protein
MLLCRFAPYGLTAPDTLCCLPACLLPAMETSGFRRTALLPL